jgi:hypothetical protein
MLIRIFSPTECGLIRDADLKKCGLNRMTTVVIFVMFWHSVNPLQKLRVHVQTQP